jgi:3-deoxy-manno-octulosonate cytidylyltransferase (CMP-KDO synthetase)
MARRAPAQQEAELADSAFRVVIPARYASTRFPGKPLALLAGKTMIRHVHERAAASGAAEVIVATDDQRIAAECRNFGAVVAMTRGDHASGTDRVAEVARRCDWPADSVVVNVQGDAPLVPPASIAQVAALLAAHPAAAIATLCTPITAPADYANPNVVKVVVDRSGRALYFSRASIPAAAHGTTGSPEAWRHIGLYAYRVRSLQLLSATAPCRLEQCEHLEQLRALWLGLEIRVAQAAAAHGPDVDIPEDLAAVRRTLESID